MEHGIGGVPHMDPDLVADMESILQEDGSVLLAVFNVSERKGECLVETRAAQGVAWKGLWRGWLWPGLTNRPCMACMACVAAGRPQRRAMQFDTK